MVDAKLAPTCRLNTGIGSLELDTTGSRIHVQWDHGANATPNALLTFIAEFLAATGIYDSWIDSCPLSYSRPNAHSKRDVLGTWLLAILAYMDAPGMPSFQFIMTRR